MLLCVCVIKVHKVNSVLAVSTGPPSQDLLKFCPDQFDLKLIDNQTLCNKLSNIYYNIGSNGVYLIMTAILE
jgi:hypothetical protein